MNEVRAGLGGAAEMADGKAAIRCPSEPKWLRATRKATHGGTEERQGDVQKGAETPWRGRRGKLYLLNCCFAGSGDVG